MPIVFYGAGAVSVLATLMVITRRNAVHALLYMIVSLLSVALVFFALGAPFVAALEVIIYAGAIMVLFVFIVMMLNLGREAERREGQLLEPKIWRGPAALSLILLVELVYVLLQGGDAGLGEVISPVQVGAALFGPYLLGVELASFLLLAGLVGSYHLGHRLKKEELASEGGGS